MARTRQRANPDERIKYLVKEKGGEFVIEVPASLKLTFSAVNPERGRGGFDEGHCLRVWEGEKLRAVYGNVTGFRDLSIPLARKIKREVGEASWTQDSSGNFERNTKVDVEHQLVESSDDIPF
jgi:hypothetical protein